MLLTECWPGIVKPDDDLRKAAVFRAGRWFVTDSAIICCMGEFQQNYEIGIERLDEMNWFAHLLLKPWLYDPSDMIDAFEAAHVHLFPHASQAQREAFIEKQIQKAMEQHLVPFYSSRALGRHVYTASRMGIEERIAFCQFLAERGFVAES